MSQQIKSIWKTIDPFIFSVYFTKVSMYVEGYYGKIEMASLLSAISILTYIHVSYLISNEWMKFQFDFRTIIIDQSM